MREMDEYEERQIKEFKRTIKAAMEEVLDGLSTKGRPVTIENLVVNVRYASGGGAIACEQYLEAPKK